MVAAGMRAAEPARASAPVSARSNGPASGPAVTTTRNYRSSVHAAGRQRLTAAAVPKDWTMSTSSSRSVFVRYDCIFHRRADDQARSVLHGKGTGAAHSIILHGSLSSHVRNASCLNLIWNRHANPRVTNATVLHSIGAP